MERNSLIKPVLCHLIVCLPLVLCSSLVAVFLADLFPKASLPCP